MREPFTYRQFCSFVGIIFIGQPFADPKINIPCVNPERTYLEKLFLLHEEFQRPNKKIRVKRLSRHLYDVYQLSKTDFAPNLKPIPPDDILTLWEKDYKTLQNEMIYGKSLPFDQLIDEIRKIVKQINQTKF